MAALPLLISCEEKEAIKFCYPTTSTVSGSFSNYTTTVFYDASNRVNSQVFRYPGSDSLVINYSYNSQGRLASADREYASGNTLVTKYSYDASGRLATAIQGSDTIRYTWNSGGQLIHVQTTFTSITFSYPNETTRNYSSTTAVMVGGGTPIVATYEYDNKPNARKAISYISDFLTDNNETEYTWDGAVYVTTYEYNDLGYPISYVKTGPGGSETGTFQYNCR